MNLRWLFLFSSFVLVSLGQPARFPLLGIGAAAIGFALFWRGYLLFLNPSSRFWISSLWFAAVQLVQLSWMSSTEYMGPLILIVYLTLNAVLGIQFALFCLYIRPSQSSIGWLQALCMAGSWVFLEWVRLFWFSGFSWNPVGLALSSTVTGMQGASLLGVFGLSFWVILTNLFALNVFREFTSIKRWLIFTLTALLPYGYGAIRCLDADFSRASTLKVALVQTGLLPEQKEYDSSRSHRFIPLTKQWERIAAALREAIQEPIDLIVLPEAVVPYGAYEPTYELGVVQSKWIRFMGEAAFSDLPPLQKPFAKQDERGRWIVSNSYWLQGLANHYRTSVVAGLDDGVYNAAFLFRPGHTRAERYEKRILVPVSEYIPLQGIGWVSQLIGKHYGIDQSFTSGASSKVFDFSIPLSISICYEETFGDLIRESRAAGAELFVNVSNDAWFPSTTLAQQHFDHGRMRAVENGVPVLRSCNTGITGAIDSLGRVVARLDPSEQEAAALFVNLPLATKNTLYVRWGDRGILLLSGIFIFFFFWMKNRLD